MESQSLMEELVPCYCEHCYRSTGHSWFMPNLAFSEMDMKSDLESRLYFLKQGYDSATATANDIANRIVDG